MDAETAQAIEMKIAEEWTITPSQVTQVGFKRLTDDAVIPTKAHPSDSGFDLVASADVIVEPGETVVVPTGIAVQLPAGFEGTVRPRSGVTAKTKLRVQLGTIDEGYGGEIGVIVDNIATYHRDDYFLKGIGEDLEGNEIERSSELKYGYTEIRKGDRIAQLVITRLPDVEAVEVFDVEESERGDRGFGSSGINDERVGFVSYDEIREAVELAHKEVAE